jgi:hypothetical protein
MADSLHNTLATFRDSILQSIARLEFQLRDSAGAAATAAPSESVINNNNAILQRLANLETKLHMAGQSQSNQAIDAILTRIVMLDERLSELEEATQPTQKEPSHEIEEILTIEEPTTTRNIVIPSIRSTPALAAAVAAANPAPIALDSASEGSGEVIEEEESESEDSGPDLKKVIIKGVPYYMDESNTVYQETEDGYEEVGTYNPKLDRVEIIQEEEEVEEEEEEAIETEEFVYKGHTYQRDAEGNVYDDEGNGIGFWNGKKIVAAVT